MKQPEYNIFGRLYFWAANRLYQELAWMYDVVSWLVSFGHWASWRRDVLDYVTGDRILEIGFGTGELLMEMAAGGYNVVGLDRSWAMQHITDRKLKRAGIRVPCVQGVVQSMPFAAHTFGTIISTFPAEFILDQETLYETVRLLSLPKGESVTDGGRLVIVGLPAARKNVNRKTFLEKLFAIDIKETWTLFVDMAGKAGLKVQVEYPTGSNVINPVVILTRA